MAEVDNYLKNKLKIGKSPKKEEEEIVLSLRVELKPFIMAEVGNYLY